MIKQAQTQRWKIKPWQALIGLLAVTHGLLAEPKIVSVSDYGEHFWQQWQPQVFAQETHYRIVSSERGPVLKAVANQSASGLYRRIQVDVEQTPFLNWSWKVDNIYAISNQQIKAGDDYPARVYVVIKTGIFPWQTRAINYVWSSKADTPAYWPNPFTANAVMIPLRFAEQGLGQWQVERVNIKADYRRVFGEELSSIQGVAIMSDADNAGGQAVAYYGPIYFSAQ